MCFSVTKTLDGSIFVRTRSLKPEPGAPRRGSFFRMSFQRHQEIFPKQRSVGLEPDAPCPRLDEFPAGYSLTGCSPALPVSASPADTQSAFVLPQFRGFWPSSIVLPMSRNTCYPSPRPKQAGGGVVEGRGGMVQEFLDHTTPAAPSKEASRYFSWVAATPPPAGPVAQRESPRTLSACGCLEGGAIPRVSLRSTRG